MVVYQHCCLMMDMLIQVFDFDLIAVHLLGQLRITVLNCKILNFDLAILVMWPYVGGDSLSCEHNGRRFR